MVLIKKILENRLALVTVTILCVMGLLAGHMIRANSSFSHEYLIYAAASDDADLAVYLPTAVNNPARAEVNKILREVLQNPMTSRERLSKAERGLVLSVELKSEIDAMSEPMERTAEAILAMEKSLSFAAAPFQHGYPQNIVVLAHKRHAAMKDIQALSYRANFETEQIFAHLVTDNGELSSDYILELNNRLPATQDDFDRRQNRYRDLQILLDEIQSDYAGFVAMTK